MPEAVRAVAPGLGDTIPWSKRSATSSCPAATTTG